MAGPAIGGKGAGRKMEEEGREGKKRKKGRKGRKEGNKEKEVLDEGVSGII